MYGEATFGEATFGGSPEPVVIIIVEVARKTDKLVFVIEIDLLSRTSIDES